MTCIMKTVKGISRWFLLKLKLFKLKMKQLSFFLSDSYGRAHDCSHLDSSKSERCAVKFSKMFLARYKGKNLIFKIKVLLKFFGLEMNQSNAWQKSKQQIMIRIS